MSKFQHHKKSCSKCGFFLKFKSNFLVKSLLNECSFCYIILDLISCVHLLSFVMMLPKQLKHSTFTGSFRSIIICCGDDCFVILIALVLFRVHFNSNSTFQFQLAFQSCPLSPFLPQPVTQDHLCISWCKLFVLLSGSFQTLQQLPWQCTCCTS